MLWVHGLDPDVPVTERLLSGKSVSTALIDAGADAELLALGAHGRQGHPGTLTEVLTHAGCNIMIAR
jgi:hypothetical protein